MNLLQARYVVQLQATKNENLRVLKKIAKDGDGYSPHLNRLFAHSGEVLFKKLNPPGITNDYILYPIVYGFGDERSTLLLETSLNFYPYGLVEAEQLTDCILYRISENETIEFFVSMGNINMSAQLLTMFIDGCLNQDINNLIKSSTGLLAINEEVG